MFIIELTMSGRPRTTSFAEGNKGPLAAVNFPGMKISSKFLMINQKDLIIDILVGILLYPRFLVQNIGLNFYV